MTPGKKIIIAVTAFVVLVVVAIVLFKKYGKKASPYEGQLVKGSGNDIFLVQSGEKHYVPTIEKLNAIKANGVQSVTIPDAELAGIKLGPQV